MDSASYKQNGMNEFKIRRTHYYAYLQNTIILFDYVDFWPFTCIFLLISRNHWTTTTHMRAIDVWVVLCYIGIFSSLMEYCGILYLTEDSESKNGNYKKVVAEAVESGENNSVANPTELQNTRLVLANTIEKIARILFPVYNIFFPIIYFIICLL